MKKIIVAGFIFMLFSCISTKSTIRNIDDTIPGPSLNEALGSFIITKKAADKKYAFDEDYPVNVGFTAIEDGVNNEIRFLNALAGPNGEKIKFELKGSCCPFPTKKTEMGAGILDIYEITWPEQVKPVLVYLNKFEKGELLIPVGFSIRK